MIKNFTELTYYEILELPVNASYFEIRQAYKEALSVYNEDSLATYTFFSDDERDNILKKIEDAFLTLIDENRRADYDKRLLIEGKVDESQLNKKETPKAIPLFDTSKSKNKEFFVKKVREKIANSNHDEMEKELLSKDAVTGSDLKKLRESLGIELEEIFEITRINISTLESMEDDLFDKLPPSIYLENFLRSYAALLQLDAKKITKGYIKNISYIQQAQGRID